MARGKWLLRAGGRWLGLWLALTGTGLAERLPIKTYTMADGLARDHITRIVRDARGFLWIGTSEGLSRFDGYQFTTYTRADGLPHPSVRDVLETRRGQYWVATGDGLCWLNLMAGGASPKFEVYRPDPVFKNAHSIRRLLEDRAGTLWCGTDNGLFRLRAGPGGWTFEPVPLVAPAEGPSAVAALLEDRRGDLWIGSYKGLFRRRPDGRLEHYTERHGLTGLFDLTDLVEDHAGRLWLATRWWGLHRLVREPAPDRPVVEQTHRIPDAPFPDTFLSLFAASDGRLWAGRHSELVEVLPADDPRRTTFRRYTAANGLAGMDIWALNEDRDGNLWLGSEARGVAKIVRQGFTLYTDTDGLLLPDYGFTIPNRRGDLYLRASRDPDNHFIGQFNGQKFVWPRERWPGRQYWWGFTSALQDHTGEWWIPTKAGLLRLPATTDLEQLARAAPRATYTARDGLSSDVIFGLHEDARGDLWIAHNDGPPGGLTRWARANGRFHRYSLTEDTPFLKDSFINAFGEDRAGQIWMGLWLGGLVRHRAGQFTTFTAADGVPAGTITAIYRDGAGRQWIAATSGGVARLDDPAAERPRFVTYSRANGLASDSVHAITEDHWGRIYLATGRGINRIDPATGRIKHYTTADGLPENSIGGAFRDSQDALWFATRRGLARLVPEPDRPAQPPVILISGLRIAGAPWPVSELGQAEVKDVEVPPGRNPVQVDFFGLSFAPGERLRYQYRFDGDRPEWNDLGDARTLPLPLGPGRHRLQVRAVSSDGQSSPSPALVTLTVLRPVWQRGWFLTLAALTAGLLLYALYRTRVRRLLELERVRTRIATDLHDDIGSNLSRMAILSEAVKQQTSDRSPESAPLLTDIADSARQLVDAMSDIVWAIDPRQDDAGHLTMRLRQFAADMFDPHGIGWELQTPPELEHLKLTPEQRRQVFLISKEAIHNIVKHAGATVVTMVMGATERALWLEVQDDGRGFAATETPAAAPAKRRGQGLSSMKARAAQLGGALAIESRPGHGTRLRLHVPL